MAETKGLLVEIGANTSKMNKALNDLNGPLKKIQSELNFVEKGLKLDPRNADLLKQKMKLLGDAVKESDSNVEQLKSELARLEANGAPEEQIRRLEREIVMAEDKSESLKNQLKEVANQVSKTGQASAKLKDIGKNLETAGQKMADLARVSAAVSGAIGVAAYKSGQWADDLNTLSKITGISTDKLQIYAAAADLVDVDVNTIATSMAKMKKAMASASEGTGATAEAFDKLGIDVTDSTGQLRDQDSVFSEVLTRLGKMSNETERDALAMKIFGKSAMNLNPLIEDSGETYKEVVDTFNKNQIAVVDQKTLDNANKFNDSVDMMKASLQQAGKVAGASLAESLAPAMEKVSQFAQDIASKIAQTNPVVLQVIGVVGGIIAVLGVATVGLGKVAFAISNIILVVPKIINGIKLFAGAFRALGASLMANPIGLIVTAIGLFIVGLIVLYKKSEKFRNIVNAVGGVLKKILLAAINIVKAKIEAFKGVVVAIINAFKTFGSKISSLGSLIKGKLASAFNKVKDIGKNIVLGLWRGIGDKFKWIVGKIKSFTSGIKDKLKSFFGIKSPSRWARDMIGANIVKGMVVGIEQNRGMVNRAMGTLVPTRVPSVEMMSNDISNAIGTGLAINSVQPYQKPVQLVVQLGGVKVAEQIYKLNQQGKFAMEG